MVKTRIKHVQKKAKKGPWLVFFTGNMQGWFPVLEFLTGNMKNIKDHVSKELVPVK